MSRDHKPLDLDTIVTCSLIGGGLLGTLLFRRYIPFFLAALFLYLHMWLAAFIVIALIVGFGYAAEVKRLKSLK